MNILARNWWALSVRGLLGLAFGIIALAWPAITLVVMVVLFGIYALLDGIFAIVSSIRAARQHERWWPVAIEGVLGIAAGIVALSMPGVAAFGLLIIIAVWAITTGILEISAAIRLRKLIKDEWLLALSGVLSIAFGILLLLRPSAGLLAVVWLIAAYAIVYGAVLVVLSLRLRQRSLAEIGPPAGRGVTPQPV